MKTQRRQKYINKYIFTKENPFKKKEAIFWGFSGGPVVKNLPCIAGDKG